MKRFIVNCWVRARQSEMSDMFESFTVNAESAEAAVIRAKQIAPRAYDIKVIVE
jgi:hypothetical protein